jgi:hypothetical protein
MLVDHTFLGFPAVGGSALELSSDPQDSYEEQICEWMSSFYFEDIALFSRPGGYIQTSQSGFPQTLSISLGRGRGHTEAVRLFTRRNPTLKIGYIGHSISFASYRFGSETQNFRYSAFDQRRGFPLRFMGLDFDLIILDIPRSQLPDLNWRMLARLQFPLNSKMIVLASDAQDRNSEEIEVIRCFNPGQRR